MKLFTCKYNGKTSAHCEIERGVSQKENFDYGVLDEKGRRVGGCLITWIETYHDNEDGYALINPELIGKSRFIVRIQSTRDGRVFGAISRETSHATAAEMNAYAYKAIDRARKRAQKIHQAA